MLMNFTDRQLLIIAYILNHNMGVIGNKIANHFAISLRTLQNEIEVINSILPKGEAIIGVGKKGYNANNLSFETKEKIADELDNRVSIRMPINRVSTILTILMFQKDYISMEKLAEIMFVSKATIFNEFKNSIMLKKFVDISKTKGLLAKDTEIVKRNELSKIFDERDVRLFDAELAEESVRIEEELGKILPMVFIESDYPVSGLALIRFKRYLMISAIRIKCGFKLDTGLQIEHVPLIDGIVNYIENIADVKFEKEDIDQLNIKLLELNSFEINYHKELEKNFDQFRNVLSTRFLIDWNPLEMDKRQFLTHIEKLEMREKYEHYNYNVLKKEIHRKLPLSTHLILECFSNVFDISLPDTEVTLLALYLGKYIAIGYGYPNCVIVTDLDPSIAYFLRDKIKNELYGKINSIEIIPDYIFEKNNENYTDTLVLTTKKSLLIKNDNLILINAFIKKDEMDYIRNKLNSLIEKHRNLLFRKSFEKYVTMITVEEQFNNLDDMLMAYGESRSSWYDFVTDSPVILFPVFDSSNENSIKVYDLKKAITYRARAIKYVIFSSYNENSNEIQHFYDTIRYIIEYSRKSV